ncbi:hypothetical protein R6Q57_028872 [Mikania cordata]
MTELRLGLPGGGGREITRKDKKRVFGDIIGGGGEVVGGGGGGKHRNMEAAVVGWPPVCSHRSKQRSCIMIKMSYVKVSKDGEPFLRKIDISGFKGYSDFLPALENLFALGDECDCEYTPIYENKSGDWMLVGFVPWEIFTETCKRLRMKKRVLDDGQQTKNLMKKTDD